MNHSWVLLGGGGSSASWEVSSASCLSYACNFPIRSILLCVLSGSLGFASLTSIFEIRKQINTVKLLVFDYFWGFFEGNSLWKLNDFGCFWNFSPRIPVHRFGIPRIPVHRFGILESLRIPTESLEKQFVISSRIPDKNPWESLCIVPESLRIPVHRIPRDPWDPWKHVVKNPEIQSESATPLPALLFKTRNQFQTCQRSYKFYIFQNYNYM